MQISISNLIKGYRNGISLNALTKAYETRVLADGGTVESLKCVNNAAFMGKYNWAYYVRVTDDGGTVESLGCIKI